jgi:hypothetical protein
VSSNVRFSPLSSTLKVVVNFLGILNGLKV